MAHKTTKFWLRLRLTVVLVFSTGALNSIWAQAPGFEKILFPIVTGYDVPGAFGSRWASSQSVLNTSHASVAIDGGSFCFSCRLFDKATLEPGVSYAVVPLPGAGGVPGSFLFVEHQFDEQLHFSLLVRDVSQSTETWGTEIPVVRESQFRSDHVELLGVPLKLSNYRYTLRIYSLDPAGGKVNVRVFEQDAFVIPHSPLLRADLDLGEAQYTLIRANASVGWAENYPGYAEVSALPMSREPELGVQSLRVEIEPVTPGLRIWAFLTLTNNTTQSVTVVSPH